MAVKWSLYCSSCKTEVQAEARAGVCQVCGQPFFVRYNTLPSMQTALVPRWDMWRYRAFLPIADSEEPISLGEGLTSLIELPNIARELGLSRLWIKDESANPTGSFKARGMSAAVTRALAADVPGLVVPTAGNAGAALAAYGAAATLKVQVFAPDDTPTSIIECTKALGASVTLVRGHIGELGPLAREFAASTGYLDMSTLREPYRIEGKKTLGLEIAEQLGWRAPTHIVYPTGGGTGLIGIWKAFQELREIGWIPESASLPRMIAAQAARCAPIVRAYRNRELAAVAWEHAETFASGLRVPFPFGHRLILNTLYASGGTAHAVEDLVIRQATQRLAASTGVDVSPEGGCAFAVCESLRRLEQIDAGAEVVLLNTGTGASYRPWPPVPPVHAA